VAGRICIEYGLDFGPLEDHDCQLTWINWNPTAAVKFIQTEDFVTLRFQRHPESAIRHCNHKISQTSAGILATNKSLAVEHPVKTKTNNGNPAMI
jgi:hypothetical protein